MLNIKSIDKYFGYPNKKIFIPIILVNAAKKASSDMIIALASVDIHIEYFFIIKSRMY